MTQDEIIRMAREAWKDHPMYGGVDTPDPSQYSLAALERFAALVAEAKDKEIAELKDFILELQEGL